MSKESKAQAAAAQTAIDDEPDEWCVEIETAVVFAGLMFVQGQEDLQYRLRGCVRWQQSPGDTNLFR